MNFVQSESAVTETLTAVGSSALFGILGRSSKRLCILLQEVYLSRSLDGNSLHCSHSLNRCGCAGPLRNQIRSDQRACPAETSLAVDRNRSLRRAVLSDESNELRCLLHSRWAAIWDWQTKKGKASRLIHRRISPNFEERDDCTNPSRMKSYQFIVEGGQRAATSHASLWVNERHRHTSQDAWNHPPKQALGLWRGHVDVRVGHVAERKADR